jgi:uncharacterized membrane protein
MLDKIIQMPTKSAHDFSGLFFIVWKKNLRGNKNTLYNVIGDTYRSAHNIFFEWLALFGIIGFLALMVSVFLLPLKFFFQTIKNNPEKSWADLVGIWITLKLYQIWIEYCLH